MNSFAWGWTWITVLLQTALMYLTIDPPVNLTPGPGVVNLPGAGRPRILLVFFPDHPLYAVDVGFKAQTMVDAVSQVADVDLYWPGRATWSVVNTAATAIPVVASWKYRRVLIVGESTGGVAAMYLADTLGVANITTHVVTAASPLQGTGAAALFHMGAFDPNTNFTRGQRWYARCDSRHFATTHDLLVFPASVTTPDGREPEDLLWGVPHGAVLLHPRVVAHVTAATARLVAQEDAFGVDTRPEGGEGGISK